jgi:hypothetical protein
MENRSIIPDDIIKIDTYEKKKVNNLTVNQSKKKSKISKVLLSLMMKNLNSLSMQLRNILIRILLD